MYATLTQLKTYNKQKKTFAKLFGANESTVQKCSDALVAIAIVNAGIIIPANFELAAQSEVSVLHQIFDWTVTQAERIGKAEYVLSNIPLLISSDNILYIMNRVEA